MSLARIIKKYDFNQLGTPDFLRVGQVVIKKTGMPEIKAAAGWLSVLVVTGFWFIEPYDWCRETFGVNFGPFKKASPQ